MAQAAIYRPRRPQESALYQCLEHYWEEFQQAYTLLYEKDYGPLRPLVVQTVERFLECGILRHGFARIRYGNQMEIIAFIEDWTVIRKILQHLNLWEQPQRAPPPPLDPS